MGCQASKKQTNKNKKCQKQNLYVIKIESESNTAADIDQQQNNLQMQNSSSKPFSPMTLKVNALRVIKLHPCFGPNQTNIYDQEEQNQQQISNANEFSTSMPDRPQKEHLTQFVEQNNTSIKYHNNYKSKRLFRSIYERRRRNRTDSKSSYNSQNSSSKDGDKSLDNFRNSSNINMEGVVKSKFSKLNKERRIQISQMDKELNELDDIKSGHTNKSLQSSNKQQQAFSFEICNSQQQQQHGYLQKKQIDSEIITLEQSNQQIQKEHQIKFSSNKQLSQFANQQQIQQQQEQQIPNINTDSQFIQNNQQQSIIQQYNELNNKNNKVIPNQNNIFIGQLEQSINDESQGISQLNQIYDSKNINSQFQIQNSLYQRHNSIVQKATSIYKHSDIPSTQETSDFQIEKNSGLNTHGDYISSKTLVPSLSISSKNQFMCATTDNNVNNCNINNDSNQQQYFQKQDSKNNQNFNSAKGSSSGIAQINTINRKDSEFSDRQQEIAYISQQLSSFHQQSRQNNNNTIAQNS